MSFGVSLRGGLVLVDGGRLGAERSQQRGALISTLVWRQVAQRPPVHLESLAVRGNIGSFARSEQRVKVRLPAQCRLVEVCRDKRVVVTAVDSCVGHLLVQVPATRQWDLAIQSVAD